MNGVGPITVGRLLGHRKRRTTAIYAHLDDATRRDAAAQAAAVIAGAMGYRTAPPPLPDEADGDEDGATRLWCMDLRISISGSASVFESLSCLSSSTHRVATISPEPSTGS